MALLAKLEVLCDLIAQGQLLWIAFSVLLHLKHVMFFGHFKHT